jgi:hypothetical protein
MRMFVGIREGGWLAFPVWRKTTTASIINVDIEPEGGEASMSPATEMFHDD